MNKSSIKNILIASSFSLVLASFLAPEIKAMELSNQKVQEKRAGVQNEKRKEFLKKIESIKDWVIIDNLYKAMINNDYKSFKHIMDNDKQLKDQTGFFMEMAGYFLEDTRILDILLERDFLIIDTYTIENALKSRNFAFLEHLFNKNEYYVNSNYFVNSAKFEAFGQKDLEEFMKKYPARYNNEDRKGFAYKIKKFDKETIKKYLDEGFTFTEVTLDRLVKLADKKEDIAYLKSLYSKIPTDTDLYQESILLEEIESKVVPFKTIKWFIDNNHDVYEENEFGENALGVAVRNKKEDVILYLLETEMTANEEFVMKTKFNKKEHKFETIKFKNLYLASKHQGLTKVQKFLEENHNF